MRPGYVIRKCSVWKRSCKTLEIHIQNCVGTLRSTFSSSGTARKACSQQVPVANARFSPDLIQDHATIYMNTWLLTLWRVTRRAVSLYDLSYRRRNKFWVFALKSVGSIQGWGTHLQSRADECGWRAAKIISFYAKILTSRTERIKNNEERERPTLNNCLRVRLSWSSVLARSCVVT